MSHTSYLNFQGLLELESGYRSRSRGMEVGVFEENQQCLAVIPGEAIIVFLGKTELIFLDGDVIAASLAKEIHHN